jgi:hypothetical protein
VAWHDLIVEGFEKTGTRKGAARYAGIARTTLRDWYRRNPVLRETIETDDNVDLKFLHPQLSLELNTDSF